MNAQARNLETMDAKVRAIIEECTRASDEERIHFPEVVVKLGGAGVERYHADLIRGAKTYYLSDGTSQMLSCHAVETMAPLIFSASGVEAAVHAIQNGRIKYREFCEAIASAGAVGYFVTLAGRRAIYYGRTGDSYTEPFPDGART